MRHSLEKLLSVFLRNRSLKLLAVVLASLTWYYIRETTSFEETIADIPLNVSSLPDGWALQEVSAKKVAVTFRGSQADIRNLEKNQISVEVKAVLNDGEPSAILKLDRSNVSAPRSVRPVYLTPSEVKVVLDRESEKTVEVKVTNVGEAPEGYFLEGFTVSPEKVKIFGPEKRLSGIEYVRTQPVDISSQIRSFSNSVELVKPGGDYWEARMDAETVMVSCSIIERTLRRDFKNVPVRILTANGAGTDMSIVPRNVDISVKCRVDVVSNLNERSVSAFIDAGLVNAGVTSDIPVEVTAMPGVTIMMIDPPSVVVHKNGSGK